MTATVSDLGLEARTRGTPEDQRAALEGTRRPRRTAQVLFRNSAMTLTYETRLIAALHALKLAGVGRPRSAAAQARHQRESLFHVESAELLQQRHAKTPFTRC